MDRESALWTRRTNANKPSIDYRDSKTDSHSRGFNARRLPGSEATIPGKPSGFGAIPPLNTNTVASPGASTAFGLGSGAFASFGSAAKTPKTPGTAFDFSRTSTGLGTPTTDTDKQLRSSAKPSAAQSQAAGKENTGPSAETKQTWPLKTSWVMWYRPPTSKTSDYEKSIKPMYKMGTAQEFWRVYSHLKRPSALPVVSDYHFFKGGIRPVWEDEENKKGGKWVIRFKKGVMDRYWDDLLLAAVGDQFAEAGEEVCGLVVSVRSGEDVLSVWTKNDGGRNIKIRETIKRVLSLPSDTIILWKSHDDSIAQRSAIDLARQEKGTTEKRRVNNTDNAPPNKEKAAVA